jgi:predicted DNA-binding protein (MmcQ/YjbR family)
MSLLCGQIAEKSKMPRSERTISDAVRDIMASLPETEEFVSHGAPTFRVRGKIFACYTINHHGDGRVALTMIAPSGAQAAFTKMRPEAYFVPPYVGPKGWLGVELDKGLDWETISEHVREAYEMVAPRELVNAVPEKFRVKPPTRKFRPEEIDRFKGKAAKGVVKKLDVICLALPETERGTQFGAPVWKAGTKTFVSTHYYTGRLKLSFWVGREQQGKLTKDGRYQISAYTGHNGWIDLDVEERQDWDEIKQLVLGSYRKFALKRMLAALDED